MNSIVQARMYDPGMGRFLEQDPIWPRSGANAYSYVLNTPIYISDPTGLWGIGFLGSGSVEAGIGIIGAGATVSAGGGLFGGGAQGLNLGGFTSFGAFIGGPGYGVSYPSSQNGTFLGILGAYLGAGGGGFITNATNVGELSGPFTTFSLNTPIFSIQFGFSGSTWIGSLSFGPSVGILGPGTGAAISTYPTNTWTRPSLNTCGNP